jgi:hypothetical protein
MHSKCAVLDAKKYRTRSRHSTNLISLSPKREKLKINLAVVIITTSSYLFSSLPNLKKLRYRNTCLYNHYNTRGIQSNDVCTKVLKGPGI